jgi:hypothetical protein
VNYNSKIIMPNCLQQMQQNMFFSTPHLGHLHQLAVAGHVCGALRDVHALVVQAELQRARQQRRQQAACTTTLRICIS